MEYEARVKLHLGCGKRFLPGFIHVDIADFPHIDFRTAVNQLPFIEDKSVDEIYSSHTLEYFDRFEVNNVLQEWHRVLRPGGQLLITVPDLDTLINIYQKTGDLKNIIGPLFGRWVNPGESKPIFHKTVWNLNDLEATLQNSGFSKITKFDPVQYLSEIDQNYDDHSLAFFPHMDRTGMQVSLALSAIKN